MLLIIRVHPPSFHALESRLDYRSNFVVEQLIKIKVDSCLLLQKLGALLKRQLVTLFQLSIVRIILLHGVVGQVNERLVN